MLKVFSFQEAVAQIKSTQTIFVHGAAATPRHLIEALVDKPDLKDVEIIHLHTEGRARYASSEYRGKFRVTNLFVGGNVRAHFDFDRVDYLPCMLSEMPTLFESKEKKIDVALISVSPPDEHGNFSLGTSVDIALSAVQNASLVIAQINSQMPRTHGQSSLRQSEIDICIDVNEPLPELKCGEPSEIDCLIGQTVANLVEDGSTLQAGIGGVPDAVLASLRHHRHLGLHTETFSDHAVDLIERGVIDNSQKKTFRGVSVSSFCNGSKRLYDFIDNNPQFAFLPIDQVNSPYNIAKNDKMVAINSAVEVDLTGQVCADSIGSRIISGVGGQHDFMMGASLSKGGKPIIAMHSRSPRGLAKIVSRCRPGAGIVTTRAQVRFIVTEYGAVDLFGKTLHERAKLLTSIAHPDDREALEREWYELTR